MTASAYDMSDSYRPTRENRVDRRNPCEWCGDHKYCLRFDDGGSFCRTVGDAHQWTDSFLGGYLHRANGQEAMPTTRLRPKAPVAEPADADTVHNVYTGLLARCPLSDEHRALLTSPQHGLADEQAARYGTLPADLERRRAVARKVLSDCKVVSGATVPGFYLDKQQCQTVGYGGGILMPRRDLQGRLTGFMVRSDKPGADPRYTWLSSASAGGPTSGSAPHIAQPRELREPTKVGIVEGIKKADVLADRLGYPHISINGVGTWGAALEVLDELTTQGVDTVVIALDRDIKPTAVEAVERSRQGLAAAAIARGYAVRIASWDPEVAKGPDDLLIIGHTFTLDRYTPAARRDDDTARLAGIAPGSDGNGWVSIDPLLLALLIRETCATATLRRKYGFVSSVATDARLPVGDKVILTAVTDIVSEVPTNGKPTEPKRVTRQAIAARTGQALSTISIRVDDLATKGLIDLDRRPVSRTRTRLDDEGRTHEYTQDEEDWYLSVKPLPDKSVTKADLKALAARSAAEADRRRCPSCGSKRLKAVLLCCDACHRTCTTEEARVAGESMRVVPNGEIVDQHGVVYHPGQPQDDFEPSGSSGAVLESNTPTATTLESNTVDGERVTDGGLHTPGTASSSRPCRDSVPLFPTYQGDRIPTGNAVPDPPCRNPTATSDNSEESTVAAAAPQTNGSLQPCRGGYGQLQFIPKEQFCHDPLPQDKACPACGGVRWRLRETPASDGRWLWACAACADRLAAYTAQHAFAAPAVLVNIATEHSTRTRSDQEDDDADYSTI